MKIERTEEQAIAKAPFQVTLGDKQYDIKPLSMLKQRAWRVLLNTEMAEIVNNFGKKGEPNSIAVGLTGALINFPEKISNLVFAYAPDLPEAEILETATEEQMAAAFSAIMSLAFPFLAQLKLVTQVVRAQLSQ